MKTTILKLESHDNLISIRDRMDWAKTPRILLVWPRHGRIQFQLAQLNLIKRHAIGLGAQVGLVVQRGDVRRAAEALQIPVYKTLAEAQRQVWPQQSGSALELPVGRRDVRGLRNNLPKDPFSKLSVVQRLTVFSLGVLALFVVAAVFLPSAEIIINQPSNRQSIVIPVSAAEQFSTVSLSGEIPVKKVVLTLQGSDSLKTTGQMQVPGQAAQASVVLENITDAEVLVPAGTILLSGANPPVRFSIIQGVKIDAGESVEILALAVNAGALGNVPENTIVGFEGSLGLQLKVNNPLPASGGTDLTRPAATEKDRAKLSEQLRQSLLQEARLQIQNELTNGDLLISDSVQVLKINEETFTPLAGQPSSELTLTMELEIQAFIISGEDLAQLANANMDASLPTGFIAVANSLKLEPASSLFTNTEGVTRWQLSASRRIQKKIITEHVILLVVGKPVGLAASLLEKELGLEQPPFIGMTPAGWPWLPWLPIRIKVILQ